MGYTMVYQHLIGTGNLRNPGTCCCKENDELDLGVLYSQTKKCGFLQVTWKTYAKLEP